MSRSIRKTPIAGHTTAKSEKDDKKLASGKLRAAERQAIHRVDVLDLADTTPMPIPKGAYDMAWEGAKDGKGVIRKPTKKAMRK